MNKSKSVLLSAAAFSLPLLFIVLFSSCKKDIDDPQSGINVAIEGSISHTEYLPDQTSTVTFNRFPTSVNEFLAVRDKIGTEPQGAVVLQLMAYEMYRRNKTIGAKVVNLINTKTNVSAVQYAVNKLFYENAETRPYQIAAFLEGATPYNGYNPTEPYTVEISTSPKGYVYSNIYQATEIYLYIKSGVGANQGTFQVLQTMKPGEAGENGMFYILANSIALNARVPEKSFSEPWNGLN